MAFNNKAKRCRSRTNNNGLVVIALLLLAPGIGIFVVSGFYYNQYHRNSRTFVQQRPEPFSFVLPPVPPATARILQATFDETTTITVETFGSRLNGQQREDGSTCSATSTASTQLAALAHFERTIRQISFLQQQQQQQGEFNNTNLLVWSMEEEEYDDSLAQQKGHRSINSLVFTILNNNDTTNDADNDKSYILVIVPSVRRVNATALADLLLAVAVTLAPPHRLVELCGFCAGSIPPFGFLLPPRVTVLDESLIDMNDTSNHNQRRLLIAGGGMPNRTLRTSIQTIRDQVIAQSSSSSSSRLMIGSVSTMATIVAGHNDEPPPDNSKTELLAPTRPFFPVEPPSSFTNDDAETTTVLPGQYADPVVVAVVGRIHAVRRMAKDLVFIDLHPPATASVVANGAKPFDIDAVTMTTTTTMSKPWRAPMSGTAMAVQLIAGQTLERNSSFRGASRLLAVANQLVLIHGFVNCRSATSIMNWKEHGTLDIVVTAFSVLQQQQESGGSSPDNIKLQQQQQQQKIARRKQIIGQSISGSVDPADCLAVTDLYNVSNFEDCVMIVNDLPSIQKFASSLKTILQGNFALGQQQHQETPNSSRLPLVGIDCEWLPSYLLEDVNKTPQPVLLLQICIHSLQQVFLFDLKTLLRPLMPPKQKMDKLEKEVSIVLGALFASKKIIKVGFQIDQDLRLLAASYPHVETFQFYNSVVECSTLGKKAIRMDRRRLGKKNRNNVKLATSSLGRMVHYFIGKKLSKIEQCSDWSSRPLSAAQTAYAALDAIVTPVMVERILNDTNTNVDCWYESLGAKHRSVKDDSSGLSLNVLVTTWRFFFVPGAIDIGTQKKLRARKVMGDDLVITQSWTTGDVPPQIPSSDIIGNDSYRDADGMLRIPSNSLRMRSPGLIKSVVGQSAGQTKQRCLDHLLESPLPVEAKLDFAARAGYVAFSNGFALFVSMQSFYPNKWLENGKTLTWYIRESEWQSGQFSLASDHVVLFVRQGRKSSFLCCGPCRVSQRSLDPDSQSRKSWALVELHLDLIDWEILRSNPKFAELIPNQENN